VDVDAVLSDHVPGADGGWGATVRAGNEWNLLLLSLTPEIQGSYYSFGGDSNAKAYSFMAGGRFGLGFILRPSVFAHVGVGHQSYKYLGFEGGSTSFAYDLGAALDFTLLPMIDFGVHAKLNSVLGDSDDDAARWFTLGGHVELKIP
jgi:hypothetical protein